MASICYMVAGLSSRFGGKIKQFAQVGPNNETLMEVSIGQAIRAGAKKIIFIVGESTETPFKEKFGKDRSKYMGVPIFYAKQSFNPAERDKPWGTADALVSAKEVINEPFIVCNGDDLYGENAFRQAFGFLKANGKECVAVGYELGKVLPEEGKTNRGIFTTNGAGQTEDIREVFGIEKKNLVEKGLGEKTLCSMNLFGLQKEAVSALAERLAKFKEAHKGDRKAECLLPVELSALTKEKRILMRLLRTDDTWLGITNPEDEAAVRERLKRLPSSR